jgi:hypothetical protein
LSCCHVAMLCARLRTSCALCICDALIAANTESLFHINIKITALRWHNIRWYPAEDIIQMTTLQDKNSRWQTKLQQYCRWQQSERTMPAEPDNMLSYCLIICAVIWSALSNYCHLWYGNQAFFWWCQPRIVFIWRCQPRIVFIWWCQPRIVFIWWCQPRIVFIWWCQPRIVFMS